MPWEEEPELAKIVIAKELPRPRKRKRGWTTGQKVAAGAAVAGGGYLILQRYGQATGRFQVPTPQEFLRRLRRR